MKKLLASLVLFCSACAFGQDSRKDATVLISKIAMIPDSVKVVTKDETFYLLAVEDYQAVFFTSNRGLLRLIAEHIMSDSIAGDSIRNIVWLQGTLVDPLTKFYRKQFKLFGDRYKRLGMDLNNFKIYRLTAYLTDFENESEPKVAPPWIVVAPQLDGSDIETSPPPRTLQQKNLPTTPAQSMPPRRKHRTE